MRESLSSFSPDREGGGEVDFRVHEIFPGFGRIGGGLDDMLDPEY